MELPKPVQDRIAEMTNEVEHRYMAMPERLYLLDADGKVAWKCGLGPHLFDPDGFEQAIAEIVV